MKKLKIKDIYKYLEDGLEVEVSDDVYEIFATYKKAEEAFIARMKYHKAYFSLDYNDGIELTAIQKVKTPEEILATKVLNETLMNELNKLSSKQANRIYAYFFKDMSLKEIAKLENVSVSSVSESIIRGLKTLSETDLIYFYPYF